MFHLDTKGRAIVHALKYQGEKRIISDIGHWIERTEGFAEYLRNAVLIPVPLHRAKERRRGFNQSLWIAEGFAEALGGCSVVYDCLERKRSTPTQTNLSRQERKKNVKNAFALRAGTCLDGFHDFVLIDDVFTTGATLDACSLVLLQAGCSRVRVATLGHG